MTTVVQPESDKTTVQQVQAIRLEQGMIVTNLGVIDHISRVGVFVVAAIRGTVWSLASGLGDIHVLDVVWHESNFVTVDVL